jgi:hypothetical protein
VEFNPLPPEHHQRPLGQVGDDEVETAVEEKGSRRIRKDCLLRDEAFPEVFKGHSPTLSRDGRLAHGEGCFRGCVAGRPPSIPVFFQVSPKFAKASRDSSDFETPRTDHEHRRT